MRRLFKYLVPLILKKTGEKKINILPDDILLFAVLRNESLRLPYFLNYYSDLGVNHFFLINNNSFDKSEEILRKNRRVHIFNCNSTYKNHWYWVEYLLEKYGKNHWCLVVDIDELFYMSGLHQLKLRGLITYLDANDYTHLPCLFLDIYSKDPIAEINYQPGESPLKYLRFFDSTYQKQLFNFWDRKSKKMFANLSYVNGGVKDRIFGHNRPPELTSKIPIFKNTNPSYLTQGMHGINNSTSSDIEGIVYHTKFLQDFEARAILEAQREEHYDNASSYKNYVDILKSHKKRINFYEEEISIEIGDDERMINLGIIKSSDQYDSFLTSST